MHICWNSWSETDFRTPVLTTTRVITYTYDPLNCLTGAYYSTGEQFEYAYTSTGLSAGVAVGNRTAVATTSPLDETTVTTYTYDAANRLTSVQQPASSIQYTWDDRGNLVSDGTFTYSYNGAGRMVRAESVTATLVYTYNAQGLRVAQSVYPLSHPLTTYAWDWASGLPEMLSEGGRLYLVGHDTLGRWDGATWAYHLPDALGSVRQETDGTGAVVSSREWTPYGVEVGGSTGAGLGYTGEWFDAGTGLLYLRARWYDGQVGRFTRRDPWTGHPWWPLTLNAYIYVLASPILRVDPTGLNPLCQCGGPGCCGPDVTAWFREEIEIHWNWIDAELTGSIDTGTEWPDGEGLPNLLSFADYAKSIPYKWMSFRNLAPGSSCPSLYMYIPLSPPRYTASRCRNTVTLCDKCINRQELGNIMFGVAGAAAGDHGVAPDLLYGAARNAEALAKPWDQAAAGVGYYLGKTLGRVPANENEMCEKFQESSGSWPSYDPPWFVEVYPGWEHIDAGADWDWDNAVDPTRAGGCAPCEVKATPPHTTPAYATTRYYSPYAGAPDYEYYTDQIPEGMLDPSLLYGGGGYDYPDFPDPNWSTP